MAEKKRGGSKLTLDALEERVNTLDRAVLGSDEYNKLIHTAMSAQTRARRAFSDQMAKGLSFYNMPST